ncbi:MAG: inorganic phosphate transporter [Candidatus Marinimicrobia bacterium]|nr:inorganic phosphate transporter [Candidatus Neomarinimicrobiota bacterium]
MTIYIIMVILLFFLAATDLMVGVTNDAVNFLNSARGARAAKSWVILIIASVGIFVGATFSSGMMEVARKGVFHPQEFFFSEIMIIYLAVMLTDVILLDAYNSLALPTSTTVSIVFELLGAAVAVSLLKIGRNPLETVADISKYINSDKALMIISGILLSVIIAFVVGAVVQFFTRLIFTFKYQKNLKRFGSIWGGLCIAIITYFILIKGAKGSSFMTADAKVWIEANIWLILGLSFVGWTIIVQLARWIFKVNVPRMIILFGTFALAFAFAGNDLVNFIGVPLAALKSFQGFAAVPGADPATFSMAFLSGKVQTETYMLLIAGAIMVITLWTSKKSKHVSKTELNLTKQDSTEERFGSSGLSRSVVRMAVNSSHVLKKIFPARIRNVVNSRFSRPVMNSKSEAQSFDMIRASMNLTVASSLIALGTSLGLPLSTTYVTFMVSMGTTLADRAWGRESAVYRITGVFTVIGGWFLTAIMAFTVSLIFAILIDLGGIYSIIALFGLALFLLYRTYWVFRKKEQAKEEVTQEEEGNDIMEICNDYTTKILNQIPEMYDDMIVALHKEDRKKLKELVKKAKDLLLTTKNRKNHFTVRLREIEEDSLQYGHFYLQMLHYIREFARTMDSMIEVCYEHVENTHFGTSKIQNDELTKLSEDLNLIYSSISRMVKEQNFGMKESCKLTHEEVLETIIEFQKNQVRRVRHDKDTHTRNSVLYLTLMASTKDLVVDAIRLLKVQSKFTVAEEEGIVAVTRTDLT